MKVLSLCPWNENGNVLFHTFLLGQAEGRHQTCRIHSAGRVHGWSGMPSLRGILELPWDSWQFPVFQWVSEDPGKLLRLYTGHWKLRLLRAQWDMAMGLDLYQSPALAQCSSLASRASYISDQGWPMPRGPFLPTCTELHGSLPCPHCSLLLSQAVPHIRSTSFKNK